MTEFLNTVYETIDEQHRDKPAATRRQLVAGAAAGLGSMGLLGWAADRANALPPKSDRNDPPNTVQNIVNIAATAEVLATILNTLGYERINFSSAQLKMNIGAASREELIHYNLLTSSAVGGKPATKRIWIPDAYLANEKNFLTALVVGDQIFINAYLLGGTVFARAGGLRGSQFARYAAEIMGVEAVHRAIALNALGAMPGDNRIGNDRALMRFAEREQTPGLPITGSPGFYRIDQAVAQLQAVGFGFGQRGTMAGAFYDYDTVSKRTPNPSQVNTRSIS